MDEAKIQVPVPAIRQVGPASELTSELSRAREQARQAMQREQHALRRMASLEAALVAAMERIHRMQLEALSAVPSLAPSAIAELRTAGARLRAELERLSADPGLAGRVSEQCRRELLEAAKQIGLFVAVSGADG